ncbi:sigma-70 family RNA polymerase sigma factor [Streptomyces sp. NPDC000594]|uniref:sigma-70 family RNA polymerase sigma factor n=1 Tax=Streptomyces sp. NPDC000594 TaxID=3154261 RepID=UPI00331E50D8
MTSSRLERPTHTTGAHRAARRAPQPPADQDPTRHGSRPESCAEPRSDSRPESRHGSRPEPRPPLARDARLDGLFTYCLTALGDHDDATAALADVLRTAERHRGRRPATEPTRTAWLYALARWACLRTLADRRPRPGAHTGRPRAAEDGPRPPEGTAERRRAEIALLAWPEAAGTTPEQRDALELAVRHGLGHRQVAAVLGLDPIAARELLATAACEVERTRTALTVAAEGGCPAVTRTAGDRDALSPALRAELVRHVDDCPRCRRAAERAGAAAPWPGQPRTPDTLPLLPAPPMEGDAVQLSIRRTRHARPAPRFGPDGFPLDPQDHAARRDRLRARAVTTAVVAAVVAAPLFALWAAYRGAPLIGEGHDGTTSVSAAENGDPLGDEPQDRYQNAGRSGGGAAPGLTAGSRSPDVSVEVGGAPGAPARPGSPGPGRLTVEARPQGDATLITLRARGGGDPAGVRWSLSTDAPWLRPNRAGGTLAPGTSVTVLIAVVPDRQPAGYWRARVAVAPAGAVVTIEGRGPHAPEPPRPRPTAAPPTVAPTTEPAPPTSDPTGEPVTPPPATGEPTPPPG